MAFFLYCFVVLDILRLFFIYYPCMPKQFNRSISLFITGVIVLQQLFFSVSYAAWEQLSCDTYAPNCEQSTICSSHSSEFQMYVNLVIDMTAALKKASLQKEEAESKSVIGLFSNKVLSLPKKQMAVITWAVKISTEWFVEWYNALVAWLAISFDIGKEALWDTLVAFKVLLRPKPFVRDYSTLLDVEASLHDLQYDLAVDWRYKKQLDAEAIHNIKLVLNEYTTNQPLFSVAYLDDSATYADVVRMLFDLTSTMKLFIGSKSRTPTNDFLSALDARKNAFVLAEKWDWWIVVQFNRNTICLMEKNYLCAKDVCTKNWNAIWKDLKDVTILKSATTESMKMIKDANKQLKDTLAQMKKDITTKRDANNPNIWLTDYQQELLRTVYGIDTTKLTKSQWLGLRDIFQPSSAIKNIKVKWALQFANLFEKDDTSTTSKKTSDTASTNLRTKVSENAALLWLDASVSTPSWLLTSSLTAAMNDVYAAHIQTFDRMLFWQSTDITRRYKEIGAFIHQIVEQYIWTKDTDWLVKYLWQTCEKQCSNRWIAWCYAD